jgi:hypothetical protein
MAKTYGLRVTFVLPKRGATLHPGAAAGDATLHVVEGQIRVQAVGENWKVGPAGVIELGENSRGPVSALEEAAFRVTWPGLPAQAHRLATHGLNRVPAYRGVAYVASVMLGRCRSNAASNLVNRYSPGQGFASGSAETTPLQGLVDPSRHVQRRTAHG